MKKYTYDNWWNGDVVLRDATLELDKDDKPILVNWSDFSESDVQKIKDKQAALFDDQVRALQKKFSEQFRLRYSASKMKKQYLADEMQECKNIMFGAIPNVKIIQLNHWGVVLENQYLSDIQYYINRTIKNGIDDGLSFLHSPNCKYQDTRKADSRTFAKFIWEYFNWLGNLAIKEDNSVQLREKTNRSAAAESLKYEVIQKRLWFKIGLLFANGEMDNLIKKHKAGTMTNCTAIALELGNRSFRPYISETINNINSSDKNIFASSEKMDLIMKYCEMKGIRVVESFINHQKTRKR